MMNLSEICQSMATPRIKEYTETVELVGILAKKIIRRAMRVQSLRRILNRMPRRFIIRFVAATKRIMTESSAYTINQDRLLKNSQRVQLILHIPGLLDNWQNRLNHFNSPILARKPEPKQDTYKFHGLTGNPDLLSLDLWDTLVGRLRPAEAVKRSSALYISLYYWKKSNYLDERIFETRLHQTRLSIENYLASKGENPSIEEIFSELIKIHYPENYTKEEIFAFVAYEIQSEIENTYSISSVHNLVKDKRFDVISDHFYNSEQLTTILDFHGIRPANVYSSSQARSSKHEDGKLFSSLGFEDSENWLHIGDNLYSDIKNAEKKGANTIWIEKGNVLSWHGSEMDEQALLESLPEFLDLNGFNRLLCTVAEISYCLVTFAIENACKFKKNQIVYLSREGETLYNFHTANQDLLDNLSLKSTKPIFFPSSRTSLFMASHSGSLAEVRQGLKILSVQYPVMNYQTFSSTLGLPSNLCDEITDIDKGKMASPLKIFESLPTLLTQKVLSYLNSQSELIKQELSNLDVSLENSLFCDLGWRGTMQDSLHRLLGPSQKCIGVYLGLFDTESTVPNSLKLGLLNVNNSKSTLSNVINFPGPLERIFTFKSQSTISYGFLDSGKIFPILSEEEGVIIGRLFSYQKNFILISKEVALRISSLGLYGAQSSGAVMGLIARFFNCPSFLEAATWFEEKHSEGFGAGDQVHYRIQSPSKIWAHPGMSKEVYKALIESRWEPGYLSWLNWNGIDLEREVDA